MEYISLIAGVFFGASAALALSLHFGYKQYARLDRERMRLWNKLMVREGHEPLFAGEEVAEPERAQTRGITHNLTSPFRQAEKRMRTRLDGEQKAELGNRLPPEMREKIKNAAEAARNGT